VDIDAEITRVLDIEAQYGLDEELTEYLKWLYHRKEGERARSTNGI
jgi:hypothetical protein